MKWRYEKYSEAGLARHKIYGGAIAVPDTFGRSYIVDISAFDRYKGKLGKKDTIMHSRKDDDPNVEVIAKIIETALNQAKDALE